MTRTVDIAVIGGGMAGASLAAWVAEEGGAHVLLVEAEVTLAQHTTGRSAAAYLPNYGNTTVRALTVASWEHFVEISARAEHAVLTPRPALWLADHDGEAEARIGAMLEDPGYVSLEGLDGPGAVAVCPVLRPERVACAALDRSGQDIDVAAVHDHYVGRLRAAGGEVVPGERVAAIRSGPAGWELTTNSGRSIVTAVVADAAGAWCDRVAEMAGLRPAGIVPHRRTIAVCRPTAPLDTTGWPLVVDVTEGYYFRPEGGLMLVSPADETPSEPCDARPDELDVALAIERVNERTTLGLRSVQSAWAGLRSFTADRTPVVGFDPSAEGFFWFGGQGGYGIQMAPALAELGAALLLGRPLAPGLDEVAAALVPGRGVVVGRSDGT
jgi:D-arginine dehydrogenase